MLRLKLSHVSKRGLSSIQYVSRIIIPAIRTLLWLLWFSYWRFFNTLKPRQIDHYFQTTFSNAFSWMKMYKFRLRFHWSFFPKGPIKNMPVLVQIMASRRPSDKPLSEPMMVNLLTTISSLGLNELTHWGRETHICVSKLTIIGSDNGLSPGRHQAITWTNARILLIGPWWTNFSEILIEIHTFSFKKMHLKMSSAKWRPFCLGFNELTSFWINTIALRQLFDSSTASEATLMNIGNIG